MTLKQFRDKLLTITECVGHGEHFKEKDDYIVWQEISGIGSFAENQISEDGYRIAVDYFTKKEYDSTPRKISALFDCNEIAADAPVIDYEPDTGYTHYSWVCEVI